jgi:hypothetical protein
MTTASPCAPRSPLLARARGLLIAAAGVIALGAVGCAAAGDGRHGSNGGSGGTSGSGGDGGDGGGGSGGVAGGGGGGSGGVTDDCPDSAKLIYLLDQSDNSLYSFKPDQNDIKNSVLSLVGKLSCNTTYIPNAMAVDRSGSAWIEYVPDDDGADTTHDSLFQVDTLTAACQSTSYKSGSFGTHYGMGFVANAPKSTDETLFVAKGDSPYGLGTLDLSSFSITPVGTPDGGPELTGTGDAKLWGFFPDESKPYVSEIDKSSGMTTGSEFDITKAAGTEDGYAFAFWGGDFWVFLRKTNPDGTDEPGSTLYHVRSSDGSVETFSLGTHWIVGAGVSTCAPTGPIV